MAARGKEMLINHVISQLIVAVFRPWLPIWILHLFYKASFLAIIIQLRFISFHLWRSLNLDPTTYDTTFKGENCCGLTTTFIMQGKVLQFTQDRLFQYSNYEVGKISVTKYSRLTKIHKSFSPKYFIVYSQLTCGKTQHVMCICRFNSLQ